MIARAMKAAEVLEKISQRLRCDLGVLKAGRINPLRGDYFHEESRTLIEIDEEQHFTSFRLATLNLYPQGTDVGFDMDGYKNLCRRWANRADNYRRNKPARGFGVGGRQRQRAYYDALRDLSATAMGYPPVIRVPAVHGNGRTAYERDREDLWDRLTR